MRKIGFTLAEVLITLTIIGVVASMTIPNLIADSQEKALVTGFKKAYSTLNLAYIQVSNDNGDPTSWAVASVDDIANYFVPYLQTTKICPGGCTSQMGYNNSNPVLDLRKNVIRQYYPQIMLKSGETIYFYHQVDVSGGLLCAGDMGCFMVDYDVNGAKLPNRHGVDIFTFQVNKTNVSPRGTLNTHNYNDHTLCNPVADTGSAGWWNGTACGAWVLKNENLDYLKCADKAISSYCAIQY